jgi:hypothetical protein
MKSMEVSCEHNTRKEFSLMEEYFLVYRATAGGFSRRNLPICPVESRDLCIMSIATNYDRLENTTFLKQDLSQFSEK